MDKKLIKEKNLHKDQRMEEVVQMIYEDVIQEDY